MSFLCLIGADFPPALGDLLLSPTLLKLTAGRALDVSTPQAQGRGHAPTPESGSLCRSFSSVVQFPPLISGSILAGSLHPLRGVVSTLSHGRLSGGGNLGPENSTSEGGYARHILSNEAKRHHHVPCSGRRQARTGHIWAQKAPRGTSIWSACGFDAWRCRGAQSSSPAGGYSKVTRSIECYDKVNSSWSLSTAGLALAV